MGLGLHSGKFLLLTTLLFYVVGCGKDCNPPALNVSKLQSLKRSVFSSGPAGYLVVPNPIEATKSLQATISDSRLADAFQQFQLPGLLDPSRLENDFVKVRIKDINDSASTLAKPDSQGRFAFKIDDVHYSEVMAYHSLAAEIAYVEQLGFSVVKSRPLYVMVRAASSSNEVNAIYDHNYLNPKLPRTIRLFGDTEFAPGMDRDMYWHEFGHLFNESASHEVKMDFAGDTGAIFSEGSALHECLADYLEYTMSGNPTIGRWLARNLPEYSPGEPLRTALDKNDGKSSFSAVITNDGGGNPERYTVAEWCSRVLWDIRKEFIEKDPEAGQFNADRLVFSAVSLFGKDTSIQKFYENLQTADEDLYCGDNGGAIENAFEKRGFETSPDSLGAPIALVADPVGMDSNDDGQHQFESSASVSFAISLKNNSRETARNVRVRLESSDPNLHITTYQQGYGDIPGGKSLSIGTGQMGYDFSVSAEIDRSAPNGRPIPYRLIVEADNGGRNVVEGKISR